MTIVAIWEEDDDIWCVADTRISSPTSTDSAVRFTDAASKIYSLPVRCNKIGKQPTSLIPTFSTTLGFAVAGSALAAAQTASVVSTLLQWLIVPPTEEHPTLADISRFTLSILSLYAKDIGSATNGKRGACEAALFGECPKSKKLEIFRIVASPNTNEYSSEKSENEENLLLLGSGKRRFQEIFDSYDNESLNKRVPRRIIEQMVEEYHDDIGGSISTGICGKSGFLLCWNAQPVEKGKPKAKRVFNGIELTPDLTHVGPCFIGGLGIA